MSTSSGINTTVSGALEQEVMNNLFYYAAYNYL